MQVLGTLGGDDSFAIGLNDTGLVVGASATEQGTSHAFLWEDSELTDLGTLGGDDSRAFDINLSAQAVGWSHTPAGDRHAVLWEGGLIQDLNDLILPETGWELTAAYGVNDMGQIVGRGYLADDPDHIRAFLLTPIPEPDALILLALGAACFGGRRRPR